jgi:hypothetical protein
MLPTDRAAHNARHKIVSVMDAINFHDSWRIPSIFYNLIIVSIETKVTKSDSTFEFGLEINSPLNAELMVAFREDTIRSLLLCLTDGIPKFLIKV